MWGVIRDLHNIGYTAYETKRNNSVVANYHFAYISRVCLLCLYVVLSCVGRGFCDGLITCPEESCRVFKSLWLRNLKRGFQGPIWAVVPLDGWMHASVGVIVLITVNELILTTSSISFREHYERSKNQHIWNCSWFGVCYCFSNSNNTILLQNSTHF
jgi:hypothetical protein